MFIQQRILLFGTLPHQQCLNTCCNFKAEALTHLYWVFFFFSHQDCMKILRLTYKDKHKLCNDHFHTLSSEGTCWNTLCDQRGACTKLSDWIKKESSVSLRKSRIHFFFCMTAWNLKKKQKKFYTYINNSTFKNKYKRRVQSESSWMTNACVKGVFLQWIFHITHIKLEKPLRKL